MTSPLKVFRNSVNGTLRLSDATTPTPKKVVVKTALGDFNLSGPLKRTLNETIDVQGRNQRLGVAVGAPITPTFTFSAHVDALSHATREHVTAFVLGLTPFEDTVSTIADDPFFHCIVEFSVGADVIECHDVEIQLDSYAESGETNTVSFTGTVRGKILINGVEFAPYVPEAA